MAFTQISGDGLKNNSITNAHLHSGAAIAGSKINPSFGNQAVTSTNSITLDGSVGDTIIKSSGAEIEFTRGGSSNITCSNSSGSLNINTGGSNTRMTIASNGQVDFATNVDCNAGLDVTGNITVSGTVDGRDLATDGTKLDGIAANATNVTNYVTNDASDELSGDTYTFSGSSGQKIVLNGATNPYIHFHEGTTAKAYIQWNSGGYLELHNQETSEALKIASGSNGLLFRHGGTDKTVFHSGNSNFVTADASDTLTGATYTFSSSTNEHIILAGSTNPYIRFQEGTTDKAYLQWHGGDGYFLMVNQESGEYLRIGSGNNGLQFVVDGTARNVMHSGNVSSYALPIGGGTVTGAVTVNGGDLRVDGGRNLRIGDGADQERILIQKADNNVSDHIIFYNGTTRVGEIGVEDGSWLRLNQETAANVYTPRMIRADGGFQVGAGTDIKFTNGDWSGNHCKIQHHSNYLYIIGGANGIVFREGDTSRWYIDGNGHLYPNGSGNYNIGNSNNYVNDIYARDIYASGGAGAVSISGGSDIRFSSGTWTGEAGCKLQYHSNVLYLQAPAFLFRDDGGSNRWQITSSGHFVPGSSNNYDIGASGTMVRDIYCSTVFLGQSTRYLSNVTGQYGSVQINGSGANGYEGFSIDGRYVLMHNGGSDGGLYNDVNNEWYLYTQANGTAIMYFNGSQRIRTESYGSRVVGTFRPNTNNSSDLGASDARWATFYVVNQPNVSDRNEKNTIQSSDLGLSFINKLRAVSFKWNDTSLGTKTRYGLIVQEVEDAIKELGKNPDDIGMIDKPEKGAMGLCVSELVAPLVKAIQELSAKVAALEAA